MSIDSQILRDRTSKRRAYAFAGKWTRAWSSSLTTGIPLVLTLLSLCSPAVAQSLPTAEPQQVGLSEAALARIAPAMQKYIDEGRVAGMVMMVARHGKLAYERALGYADLKSQTPLRADAIFRTASLRKPLLAAATMVLVDEGRLRLDDPVSKYIPSFANVRVFAGGTVADPLLAPPATPITIRHLLTHTSGLAGGYGNSPVNAIFQREILDGPKQSLAEFCDALAAIPLEFAPGTRWEYSRSFEVIARILEVVSGQPIEAFVRDHILKPVGTEELSLDVSSAKLSRKVVAYELNTSGKLVVSRRPVPDPTAPIVSTPGYFMRFGQMLLNRGLLDGKRVLSAQSVDEMLRNQLPPSLTPIDTRVWEHKGYGFGLGGAVLVGATSSDTPASPGTYRWAGSGGVFFWVDPEQDLVALIWTQSYARYWLEHHFQRLVYDALQSDR